MKVLVTGADGLLGSSIVRVLMERAYAVRAFLLPADRYASLEGLDIERVYGNILHPEDITKAVAGCEAVVHVAADTSVWPNRSARIRAINIDGTRNIVEAAKAAGIRRFVHIGSASSFGLGSKETPGTEKTPYTGRRYGLDYVDSKYEGQALVLQAARETGFPALVVAPTFMFGPFDAKPGSGRMILAVYQGKLPAYTRGGKNFVHARDVATAAVNALSMGRVGESYIAGHANLSYREITTLIAEVVGVKPPRLRAPDAIIKLAGVAGSFSGRLFKKEPNLSVPTARVALDGQYFSAQKAVRELAMPQTDIRIAVQEAFEWFKTAGYC